LASGGAVATSALENDRMAAKGPILLKNTFSDKNLPVMLTAYAQAIEFMRMLSSFTRGLNS
jgi:hypothetical protein